MCKQYYSIFRHQQVIFVFNGLLTIIEKVLMLKCQVLIDCCHYSLTISIFISNRRPANPLDIVIDDLHKFNLNF